MRRFLIIGFLLMVAEAVWAAPRITGVTTNYPTIPTSIKLRGVTYGSGTAYGPVGTTVSIVGSSFGLDGTVTFSAPPSGTGTVAATALSWDDTSIVVTVPSGAVSGVIVVTTAAGSSNPVASNPMPFVVTPGVAETSCNPGSGSNPPTITSLSPSSGPVATLVGIEGSGFGAEQGTSTVTVNGIKAFVTFWNNNTITFAVPQGATTGPVQVVVRGVGSNTITFTISSSGACVIADTRKPLAPPLSLMISEPLHAELQTRPFNNCLLR